LTAVSGSMPLLLPSPCVTGSALSCSLSGQHVGAASFTLCYGLMLCFPFSGSYNASTQSVTRLHWLPAIWQPDLYQNWTFTSKQTMIYQDTPRCVGRLFSFKAFLFNIITLSSQSAKKYYYFVCRNLSLSIGKPSSIQNCGDT